MLTFPIFSDKDLIPYNLNFFFFVINMNSKETPIFTIHICLILSEYTAVLIVMKNSIMQITSCEFNVFWFRIVCSALIFRFCIFWFGVLFLLLLLFWFNPYNILFIFLICYLENPIGHLMYTLLDLLPLACYYRISVSPIMNFPWWFVSCDFLVTAFQL